MRCYPHHLILTAICIMATLLICPALRANGIISNIAVTSNPNYTYTPSSGPALGRVGPYVGTVTGTGLNVTDPIFCLDGNVSGNSGSGIWTNLYDLVNNNLNISGLAFTIVNYSQTPTRIQQEEEAAFLASTSLALGSQTSGDNSGSPSRLSTVDGPIQYAIWQSMGTNGSSTDLKAAPFMQQAAAVTNPSHPDPFWTSTGYLSSVYLWIPVKITGSGTWTVYTYNPLSQRFVTQTAAPEPGTVVFLGTGVLLMALSRIRRRR
jgi:hypothetical protein